MKYACTLLLSASVMVGCGGNSPLSPDAVSGSSQTASAAATGSSGARTPFFFPPIDPPDISCPSDAPQVRVSSYGLRIDVDFSEIKGAYAYEIQIDHLTSRNIFEPLTLVTVPAPAHHAEWYGKKGIQYLIKVRSANCGGFGNWSAPISHTLDEDAPPSQPQPQPPTPKCMTEECTPPPPPTTPTCIHQECTPPPPPPAPQCMVQGGCEDER